MKNEEFDRAIVVFNTVEDAIRFYENLRSGEISKSYQLLLLHSRFSELDREKKIQKLKELKDKKYVIVSTQVIEAGVDLTSDLFITEIAPASSLIQRLGRFLRGEEKRGKIVIWYEVIEGDRYKVYDHELVRSTFDWLEQNAGKLKVHVPEAENGYGYQELLNSVYKSSYFEPNRELVEQLEKIHDHLEDPTIAVESLLEAEGSFVREGLLFNVLPKQFLDKLAGEVEIEELIRKYCVPVSCHFLDSVRDKILGIYVSGEGKFERWERIKPVIQEMNLRKVLRMMDPSRTVIVIEADYDEEVGLRRSK